MENSISNNSSLLTPQEEEGESEGLERQTVSSLPFRESRKRPRSASQEEPEISTARHRFPPGVMGMDHEEAVKVLTQAMETLSEADTAAYRQACRECPALIWEESPPACFLEFEGGHAKAAAQRLARYWKLRVFHFGLERAFRSMMDLSGSGCLNRDDLQIMQLGICVSLPTDNEGHTIFFADQTRLPPNSPAHISERLRCMFFYYHMAYFSSDWRKGIVFLVMVNKSAVNQDGLRLLMDMLYDGMPLRFHCIHMCCLPPPDAAAKRTFSEWVTPATHQAIKTVYKDKAVVVHQKETVSELLQSLTQHGFEKECLPAIVGGDWPYSKFYLWFKQKQQHGFVVATPTAWEISLEEQEQQQSKRINVSVSVAPGSCTMATVAEDSKKPSCFVTVEKRLTSSRILSSSACRIAARKLYKSKMDDILNRRKKGLVKRQ